MVEHKKLEFLLREREILNKKCEEIEEDLLWQKHLLHKNFNEIMQIKWGNSKFKRFQTVSVGDLRLCIEDVEIIDEVFYYLCHKEFEPGEKVLVPMVLEENDE